MVDLFNRVFGRIDATFEPRTLEEWRWQYQDNPAGSGAWLAFTPEGQVVCQYAGWFSRALFRGQETRILQVVDSMNDPDFGRGLTAGKLFGHVARCFLEQYEGPPPDGLSLTWGFPVPAAWRIGKSLMAYEIVRNQMKLACAPDALRLPLARRVEIEIVDTFPDEVGALFERARGDWEVIAIRSKEWLDWRFTAHPRHRYHIALARRAGELVGYTVYRCGPFDGDDELGLICDWLVDPRHPEVEVALLDWLAGRALADGARELVTIFPDTAPQWLAFQEAGFVARPTRYFMVCRDFGHKSPMRWLYHNWFYTLGELDIV